MWWQGGGGQRVVQGECHKTLSRVRCEEQVERMCRILDKATLEAVTTKKESNHGLRYWSCSSPCLTHAQQASDLVPGLLLTPQLNCAAAASAYRCRDTGCLVHTHVCFSCAWDACSTLMVSMDELRAEAGPKDRCSGDCHNRSKNKSPNQISKKWSRGIEIEGGSLRGSITKVGHPHT